MGAVSSPLSPILDHLGSYTPYVGAEGRACVICLQNSDQPLLKHGTCKSTVHYKCMNAWAKAREMAQEKPICPTCRNSVPIRWARELSPNEKALQAREAHPLNKWILPAVSLGAQLLLGPSAGIAVAGASAAAAVMGGLGESTGRVAAGAVVGAALKGLLHKQCLEHFLPLVAGTALASTVCAAIGAAGSHALKKAHILSIGTIKHSVKALESTLSGFKLGAAVMWGSLLASATGLI